MLTYRVYAKREFLGSESVFPPIPLKIIKAKNEKDAINKFYRSYYNKQVLRWNKRDLLVKKMKGDNKGEIK